MDPSVLENTIYLSDSDDDLPPFYRPEELETISKPADPVAEISQNPALPFEFSQSSLEFHDDNTEGQTLRRHQSPSSSGRSTSSEPGASLRETVLVRTCVLCWVHRNRCKSVQVEDAPLLDMVCFRQEHLSFVSSPWCSGQIVVRSGARVRFETSMDDIGCIRLVSESWKKSTSLNSNRKSCDAHVEIDDAAPPVRQSESDNRNT